MQSTHPLETLRKSTLKAGFTLIELSIVLVIIGLVVGGIMVGQDLIAAAKLRKQISQIDQYNMAVNAFRSKYNCLPGDCPDPQASNMGFGPRGLYPGEGDGNGLIEGVTVQNGTSSNCSGCVSGLYPAAGENGMLWSDLATASLINFPSNYYAYYSNGFAAIAGWSGAGLAQWDPAAAIGQGNYVYAYSNNGLNYFGFSAIGLFTGGSTNQVNAEPGITVQQAYSIDSKIDDGFPQTGRVTTRYITSGSSLWYAQANNNHNGNGSNGASPGTAATPTALTCYDNGGNANNPMQYSIASAGSNMNCALSFQFQ